MVPALERVELRTPGGIIDVDIAVASRHATHRNGDAARKNFSWKDHTRGHRPHGGRQLLSRQVSTLGDGFVEPWQLGGLRRNDLGDGLTRFGPSY